MVKFSVMPHYIPQFTVKVGQACIEMGTEIVGALPGLANEVPKPAEPCL